MAIPATLDSIEDALHAALTPLGTGGADFALVDRWAGEVTDPELDDAMLERVPAAFLACEGEDAVPLASTKTLTNEIEVVGRSIWRVYVVVRDVRGDLAALKGQAGSGLAGVLRLAGRVAATLNGLPIEGLYGDGRVAYLNFRPARIKRGELYAYMVRFVAERVLEEAAAVSAGAPFERFDADVNLDDYDRNPIVQTRNDL